MRQAISPASRCNLRLEAPPHKLGYLFRVRICIQIQVTAKIGPVIERFDHRNVKTILFERVADCMQERHRVLDTGALSRKRGFRPLRHECHSVLRT